MVSELKLVPPIARLQLVVHNQSQDTYVHVRTQAIVIVTRNSNSINSLLSFSFAVMKANTGVTVDHDW